MPTAGKGVLPRKLDEVGGILVFGQLLRLIDGKERPSSVGFRVEGHLKTPGPSCGTALVNAPEKPWNRRSETYFLYTQARLPVNSPSSVIREMKSVPGAEWG